MPPSPVVSSLARVEGEGGQGRPGTDRAPPVHRANRTSGVLDDSNAARLAQGPHPVQVGGHARLVDQEDGAGASGQARLRRLGDEVLRRLVDVGEDRIALRRTGRRWRSR